MIISFTGTRHGMTAVQLLSLADTLLECGASELHHGDSRTHGGADAEADAVAQRMEIPRVLCLGYGAACATTLSAGDP